MNTGREVFSLAMAMQNLVWGLVSPLAGAMADKFGAAKVAAAGAIFYAIGLFAMGAYISPEGLFFGQIMVGIGLGSAGMSIALVRLPVPLLRKKIAGAGSGCQYRLFRAICGVAGNTIFH